MPRTLGIEIEMPVAAKRTGASRKVETYFDNLATIKQRQGLEAEVDFIDDQPVAVRTEQCVSGLDNAYNNLESAIGPFGGEDGLESLHSALHRELADVGEALEQEPNGGAVAVNFSEHPCVSINKEYYEWIRLPKPIYDYWIGFRGWEHMAGVDAKAHNGPTTGVSPHEAVLCLNVLLAASPCFIALYANSPFENARPTGYRENRLTIWPRMFATSRFTCDRKLHRMPPRPFWGWGDYFNWMFGPGTCMQFVAPLNNSGKVDYKTPKDLVIPENSPSLLEYLRAPSWPGRSMFGGGMVTLHPRLRQLEFLQYSQFLDARLRFALAEEAPLEEFLSKLENCRGRCLAACSKNRNDGWNHGCPSQEEVDFSEYFASRLKYAYIEGRAPGANLPDRELMGLDDAEVPASVATSASALQMGLLNQFEQAREVFSRHPWHCFLGLREEAVRHGMAAVFEGLRIDALCHELLELASDGLRPEDRWLLAYPRHVLRTGQSGADRALATYERMNGDSKERLLRLVRERAMVLP